MGIRGPRPQTDLTSEEGARRLAKMLAEYWLAAGYPDFKVDVVMIGVNERDRQPIYGVKTNMLPNCMPPHR